MWRLTETDPISFSSFKFLYFELTFTMKGSEKPLYSTPCYSDSSSHFPSQWHVTENVQPATWTS